MFFQAEANLELVSEGATHRSAYVGFRCLVAPGR